MINAEMGAAAIDLAVGRIYSLAGKDPAAPPGCGALVRRLFKDNFGFVTTTHVAREEAIVERRAGVWMMRAREDVSAPLLNLALARGIARWWALSEEGLFLFAIDGLATALMIPHPAAAICRALGYSVVEASALMTSPAWVTERRIFGRDRPRSGEYESASMRVRVG